MSFDGGVLLGVCYWIGEKYHFLGVWQVNH